jgi:UV DNA damage endonuclease
MYRISSDIAPYITHPDLPQFHQQIEECRDR